MSSNMGKREVILVVFSMFFATLLINFVFAVPQSLNLHGKISNTDGSPLTGSQSLTFNVYNASSGGSSLYTSTQAVILDNAGIYNVLLSDVNLDFSQQYYLGISVNSDSEMTPRINLTSTPYSFRTNVSDNLEGNLNYSVSSLFSNGRIGIGTTTPAVALQIQAPQAFIVLNSTASSSRILLGNNNGSLKIFASPFLNTGSGVEFGGNENTGELTAGVPFSGLSYYLAGPNGSHYFTKQGGVYSSGPGLIINNTGYVGIGTVLPQQKLNVVGDTNLTGNLYSASNLFVNSTQVTIGSPTGYLDSSRFGALNVHSGIVLAGGGPMTTFRAGTLQIQNSTGANVFEIRKEGGFFPEGYVALKTATPLNISIYTNNNFANGIFITGNGRVGIGSTNPQQTLDVRGVGNFSGTVYINNNTDLSLYAYNQSGNYGYNETDLRFARTGTNTYLANTNDFVGIGINNPLGVLHVNGTDPDYIFERSGFFRLHITSTNGEPELYNEDTGTTDGDLLLQASVPGAVGIGTTTPQQKLNVVGSANFTGDLIGKNGFNYTLYNYNQTGLGYSGNLLQDINLRNSTGSSALYINSTTGTVSLFNDTIGSTLAALVIGSNVRGSEGGVPQVILAGDIGKIYMNSNASAIKLSGGSGIGGGAHVEYYGDTAQLGTNLSGTSYSIAGSIITRVKNNGAYVIETATAGALSLDKSANLTVKGNITAPYFLGDGRYLTNVQTYNSTYHLFAYNQTTGINTTSGWNVSGNSLYTSNLGNNIGIGTSNPRITLDIISNAGDIAYFQNGPGNPNAVPVIQLQYNNASQNTTQNGAFIGDINFGTTFNGVDNPSAQEVSRIRGIYLGTGTQRTGGLVFSTGNGGGPQEKMRLDNNGNLFFIANNANLTLNGTNQRFGVNTNNPSNALDVRGVGNFSGTVYINNNTDLSLYAYNQTTLITPTWNSSSGALYPSELFNNISIGTSSNNNAKLNVYSSDYDSVNDNINVLARFNSTLSAGLTIGENGALDVVPILTNGSGTTSVDPFHRIQGVTVNARAMNPSTAGSYRALFARTTSYSNISGTIGSLAGAYIAVDQASGFNPQTNITDVYGVRSIIGTASNGGNITNAYYLSLGANTQGTLIGSTNPIITNSYGFHVENITGSRIVNSYGVYIQEQTGASNQSFQIYSEGGKSYLGGTLGVGARDPAYKLEVAGTLNVSSSSSQLTKESGGDIKIGI